MENLSAQPIQTTQPLQQNPPIQPVLIPEKPKTNSTMIGLVVLACLIVFGFGGFYLGKQFSSTPKTSSENLPNPTPTQISQTTTSQSPTSGTQTPSGAKTYTIQTLGLQYQLPPSLAKLGDLKQEIVPGEKGNQLCLTFPRQTTWLVKTVYAGGAHCPIVHFGFGTTSTNFEAGRSGGFTDFQGFEITDGKYYGRFPMNKLIDISSDIVKEIKNPNGITILKILGKKYDVGGGMTPFPYEGSIGALVNIENNSTYQGITLQLELTDGYTEKEFDQILSSLKFVN